MGIRDIRAKARRNLHEAMQVPALYLGPDSRDPVACSVRVHDRTQLFGSIAGVDYAGAQHVEFVPKVISLVEEVVPVRGGTFYITSTEAYAVERVDPADGITVTSEVTQLRQDEIDASGLTLPETV